ncbi:HAD family hydrolase [Streptosporangium sp. NPDC049644]|uniref:HAD family hydrolase n=1 Tax=Streptosporangium sp. NPDC049644 TaxID=3155507 RepID=UPI003430CC39
MDKTGTLTKGEPEVTDVIVDGGTGEDELLRLVSAVERESEHPLAQAIAAHADARGLGIAIGAGTDVAIETADVVLMRSDPLDVPAALRIGRATLRKMRQNLGWAIGYNTIAMPIAAGVLAPAFGLVLRPEIAALSMSGSSVIVAVNALALKQLRLPRTFPAAG